MYLEGLLPISSIPLLVLPLFPLRDHLQRVGVVVLCGLFL